MSSALATLLWSLAPATVSSIDVEVGDRVQPGFPVASLNVNVAPKPHYSAHAGEIELRSRIWRSVSRSVLYTVDDSRSSRS